MGFLLRLVLGGSCFLVVDTGGAAHAVLAHEAIHAALSAEDFLGACEERMVSAPDVHMDFGLCGSSGHDHFSIADHLGVGIPGGMNVGLGHDRDQRLENWGALRAFLRPYLRRSLALGSRLRWPSVFRGLRLSAESSHSALAAPCLMASACPVRPPPLTLTSTSYSVVRPSVCNGELTAAM